MPETGGVDGGSGPDGAGGGGARPEAFRVDLRGVVDILSHHLYSSPRVYVRELLQNARDAVVARQDVDEAGGSGGAAAPPDGITVTVEREEGAVTVADTGIGLTAQEMREVLATIGASSKTGDLTQARRRFLGQFGIGLLACFLVADEIEVRSRSARTPDAPTLVWTGRADGTFTVATAAHPLPRSGTRVRVRARPDDREWVEPARVEMLVRRFAGLLDVPVRWHGGHDADGGALVTTSAPWAGDDAAAAAWCERELGFAPLAVVRLDVALAGVRGLALVADTPGRVGHRRGDRVYSRGMLVADDNTQLAPDWAYFVRLVVEAGELPLTASRESLQDGALLGEVREQVGAQVRAGVERLATGDPAAFARFLEVHATGLLAMAAVDAEMLDLVVRHVPWETSEGPLTLAHAMRTRTGVRYATSRSDFAAFAPIHRAAGDLLVNGSYVYGAEILERVRFASTGSGRIRPFDRHAYLRGLAVPATGDADAAALTRVAAPVLARFDVDLDVRRFEPASVPVLLVGGARGATAGDAVGPDARDDADPFADLLDGPAHAPARTRLVMNLASPAVGALATLPDAEVRADAVAGLYVTALLLAGERVDERHGALLSDAWRSVILAAGGSL
ncbi:HSP90 family protein [Litorihabitans aurantiacus]|uniref:Molecular chaperone HtpG n=1 Tax=Litorihabitans aurantiacus TaxID=1930061 RepID=A0AA37XHV7_9MICO|nr:HSP90 family protein [Litorihabitans aurantiacus]GMA33274.1 molecular chaperone HtpG [Litorihabitans aurantiacus]